MNQEKTSSAAGAKLAWAGVLLAGLLGGCASKPLPPVSRAPVEDRTPPKPSAPPAPVPAPVVAAPAPPVAQVAVPVKILPGAENAGKPGYYTVKPGDTLIRVGLETGQNWRDVARWNGLDNPNLIEVGQVLRVIPPGTADVAMARPVPAMPSVTGTSLPAAPTRTASAPVVTSLPPIASATAPGAASVPAPVATPVAPVASAPAAPASSAGDDDIAWIWPTSGAVLAGFDEAKNKGLDIAGKLGDPVLAAGDGRVVYAGSGLRGYGNLVILKHNNTFLTAYAHNQTLLVKEDQTVRKGQKIAELGQSDTDRAKLHFEIRRQGKPVDPARYLPAR
jgi:lipoprotein NlpD